MMNMNIRKATAKDHPSILDCWLHSVRATHSFITEEYIQEMIPLMRAHALKELELWVLTIDEDTIIGFMGLTENNVNALFLHPDHLRRGGGRMLVDHARSLKGSLLVDVNEQNKEAVQFYLSQGFKQYDRSETDSMGKPYPLLHLKDSQIHKI